MLASRRSHVAASSSSSSTTVVVASILLLLLLLSADASRASPRGDAAAAGAADAVGDDDVEPSGPTTAAVPPVFEQERQQQQQQQQQQKKTRHMVWPLNLRRGAHSLSHNRLVDAHRRRLLDSSDGGGDGGGGGAPSATLALHGSVQEHGYYYVNVRLGTPAKQFQVIVDTGSTATYVPCVSCGVRCGSHTGSPPFDPDASSTCSKIPCGADECRADGFSGCRPGGSGPCRYSKSYAEHSTAAGDVVKDVIHLGDAVGHLEFVFGCTTEESGTIYSQQADGLMGLGNGVDSLPIQLAARHALEKVFSLCYGSFGGGGAISFGRLGASPANPTLQYTPLKPTRVHPTYYVVATDGWEIGGAVVATAADFDVGYGTVMDSGTTFTYVPTKVFRAFAAELARQVRGVLEKVPGPDPSYPEDICYYREGSTQGNLGEHYPTLALTFQGGARLELPPSNYLFIHDKRQGAFCLGVMDNSGSGTLIGGITVRNTMVEYDMEGDTPRVGLATTDCDALLREHRVEDAGGGGGGGEGSAAVAGAGDGTEAEAEAPAPSGSAPGGVNGTRSEGEGSDGGGEGGDNATAASVDDHAGANITIGTAAGAAAGAGGSPPAGFIVLLFVSLCFAGGFAYVRYHQRRGETVRFPGVDAIMRRVHAPGLSSVFAGAGREHRYAQFGLDKDEDKRRPGEVELPPLLARDGGGGGGGGGGGVVNAAGAGGAALRSISPPKRDDD